MRGGSSIDLGKVHIGSWGGVKGGREQKPNMTTHKLMPTASPRSVAMRLHVSHLSRPIFFKTNSSLIIGSTGMLGWSRNGRYSTSKVTGRFAHCAMAV